MYSYVTRFFPHEESSHTRGFTLVELLCVIGIIGILASMAVPQVFSAIEEARYAAAIKQLKGFVNEITRYKIKHGKLPSAWGDLGYDGAPTDPWGHDYVFQNHDDIPKGKRRKDGPTVPLNSSYDVFSPGPNGEYKPTIQNKASQDDVIVAGDGQYIGKAEDY